MRIPSRRTSLIILLLVIIAAGVSSIYYTSYQLRKQKALSDYDANIAQIERAKGQTITLTETQNGFIQWVLKMKEIKYSKQTNDAALITVQGLVYGKDHTVLFTFTAPSGVYSKTSNKIVLNQGARIVSPKAKAVLMAPDIEWSANNGKIYASGGVQMGKQDYGTTKSDKAIVTMDFSKIQFLGHADTTIAGHSNTGAQ